MKGEKLLPRWLARIVPALLLAVALAAGAFPERIGQVASPARDGEAGNGSHAGTLPSHLTPQAGCPGLPSGAVGWWKAEGDGNDFLGTNNGVLRNGATFAPGLVGQAFIFDGVNDSVSINRPVQDDFTIEFWLNTTQVVGSDSGQWWEGQGLVDGEVLTVTNDFGVSLRSGKVLFGIGNPDVTIRSGFVADGNWHHIAVTRLRSLGEMKIFVDGSQVASGFGGTQSLIAPAKLAFGRIQVDSNAFQGALDEIAIYNRALRETEIQAIVNARSAGKSGVYSISPQSQNFDASGGSGSFNITAVVQGTCPWAATSSDSWITTGSTGTGSSTVNFTVGPNSGFARSGTIMVGGQTFTVNQDGESSCLPPAPNLIAWFQAEGNADDTKGLFSGTLLNGATFAGGKVGQAFSLDGVNDYVRIPDSPGLRPKNVTLEAWINFSASPTGTRMIFNKPFGNGILDSYQIFYESGQLQALISDSNGLGQRLRFTLTPVFGTWYHVAYTFDDATDTQVLYLNGAAVAAGTVTKSIVYDSRPLLIGADTENGVEGSFPFPGMIDEPTIYGRALSPTEIQSVFKAGSVGKCVSPVACVPTPPNLVAWWRGEATAADSIGGHNGTLQNGTFTAGRVGQGFKLNQSDGTLDQVSIPDSPALRPASFTIEALVRFDSLDSPNASAPGLQYIMFKKNTRTGNFEGYTLHKIRINGVEKISTGISSATGAFVTVNSQTAVVAGRFYHVATTNNFDGTTSTVKLYVDGVLQGSAVANFPPDYDTRPVVLGSSGETFFNGYLDGVIDEASIYNRALSEAEIQAIYGAGSAGKCSPGLIQSLTLTPNSVNGGQPSTGTVTLTTAAPAGGVVVNLSSANPGLATVPSSLTIAEGQTTGTFAVTTSVPGSDASASITASYQTSVISTNLTVLAPKPDLAVSAASVPAGTQTDAAFNVSWTVLNQGGARANAPWTDRVFLSTDDQLGNDTLLGEFPFNNNLEPNQSAGRIQTLTITRGLISQDGPYFLLVRTDAGNQINEGASEDNNFVARPINITRPPKPDLVVDGIVAPNAAFFGQTVLVQWTVKNVGGGPTNAPAWLDYVYLSTDDVPEIEDPFKIPVSNTSYLASGESYTATAEVKVPQGLVGQYKLIVWTDGDGTNHRSNAWPHQVVEDNDENNYGVARPIQLNAPTLPDLQTVSVVAPEEVFSGGQMALTWRVENHGDGVTPPDQTNWTDKIYLSQDTTLDVNTDRLVGSRPRSGALTQNEGYTVSNINTTLPNDIAGDWFVFVLADSDNHVYEFNNETNNANYDRQQPGSPVRIRATPPDLIIPTSLTAPAVGSTGQTLAVAWTVKNQGAFEAAPTWFDAVYLSADQTLNTESDTLLTSAFRGSPLGPGLAYDVTANVTVPSCIGGTYYLFVVTDGRRQIFEFDPNLNAEANNSSQPRAIQIADATPDLRVDAVGNPAAGNAGQVISVNWTVTNHGSGATAQTKWTDRVYLSPTQTFDSSTALLIGAFDRNGALNAGASYTRTESLLIPNAAQGSYFLSVLADANDEVEECANNTNNRAFGPQAVAVSNSLPDLSVQGANSQISAVGGQTVSVGWTVANQGAVAVNNPSWGDAVYFSSDAVLGNDDLRLATAPAAGPLAIGATYNRQAQATLPVAPPGNYFLIIQADYLGNVFEGQGEDNNLRNVALSIQVPAADLTVSTVDAPAAASSGQDMTVNWTVLNNGSDPTVGSHWVDEVVLSLDQIDDPSDRVVGSKQHSGALNGQASYNDSLTVFVPQGFTGQYYVFVRTDRRNEAAESNENNNSAADGTVFNLTPPADLVVSSVAPPPSGSPGEPITINWSVQNGGANPATGLWNDAVYLSSDQTWDIGDLLIGRQTQLGPLAPSQSYNGQLTTTLPGINPGNYYIIVRSDVQNRVRETSDENNATPAAVQTAIDVTALQVGVPRNTTLTTGQERFYKTDAPANETVRFALEGQAGSANELFARFGLVASRTSFDFSFGRSNEANQEVIVPNSRAGNYYTLARSQFSTPSPQSVTIKAEVIPFGITSVSPNRIGDNGQVTITLKGARFEEGATVRLSGNGTTLNAARVIHVDSSTLKARFFFTNAPHGLYDVALTNPGGQTSTLDSAVTIEQARAAKPVVVNHGSLRTRPGRPLGIYSEASNPGNVDIQYVIIKTEILLTNSRGRVSIITQRPNESLPRKADFPGVDWGNDPATNARRGDSTLDTFIYRDLPPGENLSFDTEVRGLVDGTPYVRVQADGHTRSEFIEEVREAAEAQRLLLLETNTPINDPEIRDAVGSAKKWWELFELGVRDLGYAEGVLEDVLSGRRTALGSLLSNIRTDIIANVVSAGCRLLVDTITNDCSIRCPFRAGCCAVGASAGLFATFQIPLLAVATGISAGVNIGMCFNEGLNCGKSGTCPSDPDGPEDPEDPDEEHGGSWTDLLFLEPGDFLRALLDRPIDPNDKLSPSGYGEPRFVPLQHEIPYTINFENLRTATAYAQRVRITDQLDPNLDPRTLRLREIGFKQYRFRVPENRAFFQQRVQLGPDLGNLLADISAGVDLSTGTVTWTLTAIDPATGEQPNGANLGLLPPNNDSNDGQGFVTFTIKPKTTAATGAVIRNAATITFDTEAPINTNTVSNTIDAEAPASAVNSLPAAQPEPTFDISWSGADAPAGSGLRSYDVFFSADNGPYQPLLSGTTLTNTQFTGEPNTAYRFYSIARDNSGNVEAAPDVPDAVTTVGTPPPGTPTADAATSVTSNSFTSNWGNVSGAAGYRLDVSTDSLFGSYVGGYQDLDVGNMLSRIASGLSPSTPYYYRVRAYNDGGTSGNSNTISVTTTPCVLRMDEVAPKAGRASGGQQITLTGDFACLSAVTVGGVSVSWNYIDGTGAIKFTSQAHAAGAVDIVLTPVSGVALTRSKAFAYLPTVFTDNTLVAGVTVARAQHIIELRQAVDALRAVAGLQPAPWTDSMIAPTSTFIKAIHIQELRTYLDDAVRRLGYPTSPYTDPSLTTGFGIRRIHIEELRQRVRNIAG